MNEQIKQIAERLAGLRDALEISPEEIAQVCHLTQRLAPNLAGVWCRTDHADVWRRTQNEQLFHYPQRERRRC